MTFRIKFDDMGCIEAYGSAAKAFLAVGRQSVTMTVMYSLVRATPSDKLTYVPFEIGEKDPVRKKYGTWDLPAILARDPATGLLGARQLATRHDPNKPIVYIFAPGFPEVYRKFFIDQ